MCIIKARNATIVEYKREKIDDIIVNRNYCSDNYSSPEISNRNISSLTGNDRREGHVLCRKAAFRGKFDQI